jgi:hypothetical protein
VRRFIVKSKKVKKNNSFFMADFKIKFLLIFGPEKTLKNKLKEEKENMAMAIFYNYITCESNEMYMAAVGYI